MSDVDFSSLSLLTYSKVTNKYNRYAKTYSHSGFQTICDQKFLQVSEVCKQTYENEKYFKNGNFKKKKRGDRNQYADRKTDNQRMISLTAENDINHKYTCETGGSHQLEGENTFVCRHITDLNA